MALFELLQESIRSTSDAASDFMESSKLKQKIRSEQKAVRGELQKLGEIYLNQLQEEGAEPGEEEKGILHAVPLWYSGTSLLPAPASHNPVPPWYGARW